MSNLSIDQSSGVSTDMAHVNLRHRGLVHGTEVRRHRQVTVVAEGEAQPARSQKTSLLGENCLNLYVVLLHHQFSDVELNLKAPLTFHCVKSIGAPTICIWSG